MTEPGGGPSSTVRTLGRCALAAFMRDLTTKANSTKRMPINMMCMKYGNDLRLKANDMSSI